MWWWPALGKVEVADYSWVAVGPKRGPLSESTRWPELSERIYHQDFSAHTGTEWHHAGWHIAIQRFYLLAYYAVYRHSRHGPGS